MQCLFNSLLTGFWFLLESAVKPKEDALVLVFLDLRSLSFVPSPDAPPAWFSSARSIQGVHAVSFQVRLHAEVQLSNTAFN